MRENIVEKYCLICKKYNLNRSDPIELAHIFSRASEPAMSDDKCNMMQLCRFHHERLDANEHPVTCERVVGVDRLACFLEFLPTEQCLQLARLIVSKGSPTARQMLDDAIDIDRTLKVIFSK